MAEYRKLAPGPELHGQRAGHGGTLRQLRAQDLVIGRGLTQGADDG
ncbi:hypothetical protein PV396_15380 [Streptomyces sp. ME02-8801-2C]|nr:hypothetical protein [Streptomyces sp. ME02-8801-2C]MDX3453312.1 hypothetical protein [Streptomyces sp. ME02-8801-2C]